MDPVQVAQSLADSTHIADQLLTADAGMAGLILVFLGIVASGFDSYDETQKSSVLNRFWWCAWLAFTGFAACLVSGALAVIFYWVKAAWLLNLGIGLLLIGFLVAMIAAFMTARAIRIT